MFSADNFKLMMDVAAEFGFNQRVVIEGYAGMFPEHIRFVFKHIVNPDSAFAPCPADKRCEECNMTIFCQVKDKPRQTTVISESALVDSLKDELGEFFPKIRFLPD